MYAQVTINGDVYRCEISEISEQFSRSELFFRKGQFEQEYTLNSIEADLRDLIVNGMLKDPVNGLISLKIEQLSGSLSGPMAPIRTIFEGDIRMRDCKFFTHKTAKNGFGSVQIKGRSTADKKLFSRLSRTIRPGSTKDANGEPITPCAIRNLYPFNNGGVYAFPAHQGYYIADLIRYAFEYLCGADVAFNPGVFGMGDYWNYAISTGAALRDHNISPALMEFTLSDLLTEVYKRFSVITVIDESVSPFEVTMVKESDTLEETTGITITPVFDDGNAVHAGTSNYGSEGRGLGLMTMGAFQTLKIGGGSRQSSDGGAFPFPDLRHVSFAVETYDFDHKAGASEDLKTMDMEGKYTVCSNVIHKVYQHNSEDYDADIFIFELNPTLSDATNMRVQKYEIYGSITCNEQLTNRNALQRRFKGRLPADIVSYLGDSADEFEAETGADSSIGLDVSTSTFDVETLDANGNYDDTLYRYYVPRAGVFRFGAVCDAELTLTNNSFAQVRLRVQRYDSSNVLKQQDEVEVIRTTSGNVTLGSTTFYADSGDYFTARLRIEIDGTNTAGSSAQIMAGSRWYSTMDETGGGVYAEFDPDRYLALEYVMRCRLTAQQVEDLKAAPGNAIYITKATPKNIPIMQGVTGWLMKAEIEGTDYTTGQRMATLTIRAPYTSGTSDI